MGCTGDCSDPECQDLAYLAFVKIKVSLAKNGGLTEDVLKILRELEETSKNKIRAEHYKKEIRCEY